MVCLNRAIGIADGARLAPSACRRDGLDYIVAPEALRKSIRRGRGREETFVFEPAPAEIEQQPYRGASSLEVVDHLGKLVIRQWMAESLDLYDNKLLDKKVKVEQSDRNTLMQDLDRHLASRGDTTFL